MNVFVFHYRYIQSAAKSSS